MPWGALYECTTCKSDPFVLFVALTWLRSQWSWLMYFNLLSYVFLSEDGIPKMSPSTNRGDHRARICRDPLSASFSDLSVCKDTTPPAHLMGSPGSSTPDGLTRHAQFTSHFQTSGVSASFSVDCNHCKSSSVSASFHFVQGCRPAVMTALWPSFQ